MKCITSKRRGWLWLSVAGIVLAAAAAWIGRSGPARSERSPAGRDGIASAREAIASRDIEGALRHLDSFRSRNSANAEAHFLTGSLYRRLGRADEMERSLQRAAELGWPADEIQREGILLLAQAGHIDKAEPHLRRLLAGAGVYEPEVCEAFVAGHFRVFRPAEAVRLLDRWQAHWPKDPQPHFMRGALWQHAQGWHLAEQQYRRALELGPERVDIRLALAHALVERGQAEEAAGHFRECVKRMPDSPAALAGLGQALIKLGKTAESRELFQRVLERDPGHPGAHFGMGQLALAGGRSQEAVDWLEPLVKQAPFDLSLRYALARALRSVGRSADAQHHFEFVREIQKPLARIADLMDAILDRPDDVELRYELGVTLLKSVSPIDGAGWLRTVVAIDPGHRQAHAALAEYYEQQGESSLAEQHRRHAAASR